MSPRHRRLAADLAGMNELTAEGVVTFRAEGDPPETYELLISAVGVSCDARGTVKARHIHRCAIYLHLDYPRRPPVVTWQTPIMHPNILPPQRNGGVCIGAWGAGESLADLTRRLVDLVTYRAFNIADALDEAAGAFVAARRMVPGGDLDVLIGGTVAP